MRMAPQPPVPHLLCRQPPWDVEPQKRRARIQRHRQNLSKTLPKPRRSPRSRTRDPAGAALPDLCDAPPDKRYVAQQEEGKCTPCLAGMCKNSICPAQVAKLEELQADVSSMHAVLEKLVRHMEDASAVEGQG